MRWCPHLVVAALTAMVFAQLLSFDRTSTQAVVTKAQVGLASYYGPGFHGRQTANGEVFDQQAMVAAHRTLPLGTVVRVTNLDNGRAVDLRVIDRGPYGRNMRKGAIIDVSKGAARRLHFIEDGLVAVRVEVIRRAPPAGN